MKDLVKRLIPNAFTMLNLASGCMAIVYISMSRHQEALYFVFLGIFFDFFDGFFARLFKVASPLGIQLDSLADMVTCGVTAGYFMTSYINESVYDPEIFHPWPFFGFIITLGACYRLAKFNIDTRQTDSFIGLPTPANALFILGLPYFFELVRPFYKIHATTFPWILLTISLISTYLMNAEIPLFSLKIKSKSISKMKVQIVFLLLSAVILIFFKLGAISPIILLYVLLSISINFTKQNGKQEVDIQT